MTRHTYKLSPTPPDTALPGRIAEPVDALLDGLRLDAAHRPPLVHICAAICREIARRAEATDGTLVVGVNGGQGSGKTTFCRLAEVILTAGFGQRAARFSIDDLYLTRAERQELARTVHPLFITRGVPGTHDVELGLDLIERLRSAQPGERTAIPSFDKSIDDRAPRSDWPEHKGAVDVILFEGWCVGATPQEETALREPLNALESDEDADGTWRREVDRQVREEYGELFAQIDLLILLAVPSFDRVREWRLLQEHKLAEDRPGGAALMERAAVERFILHYERLTRHMLDVLPSRADIVAHIDDAHRIARVTSRSPLDFEGFSR